MKTSAKLCHCSFRFLFVLAFLSSASGCSVSVTSTGAELPEQASGSKEQVTGPRLISVGLAAPPDSGICTFPLNETLDGETDPEMILDFEPRDSCVSGSTKMGINGAGELLVLARGGDDCEHLEANQYGINVYADATRLNGTQQPIRVAQLPDLRPGDVEMVIDPVRDLLYISSNYFDDGRRQTEILVYDNISQTEFDDRVTLARKFAIESNGATVLKQAMIVDDTMYVPGRHFYKIPNISQAEGTLTLEAGDYEFVFFDGLTSGATHIDNQGRFYALTTNTRADIDWTTSGRIYQFTADGSELENVAIISSVRFPELLGIGPDGHIYTRGTSGEVRIYPPIENVVEGEPFLPVRTATTVCVRAFNALVVWE